MRSEGVKFVWTIEKKKIEMGYKHNYTKEQIQELNLRGRISKYEGHHIKDVSNHPYQQADPNNIKFVTRDEHKKLHNGNWRNKTDGELRNCKNELKEINKNRVIKNEIKGACIAACIGFAVGFGINTICELARKGIKAADYTAILLNSAKVGVESGITSFVSYFISRIATCGLERVGIDITKNFGAAFNMFTIGVLSIALISTYQYVKCRLQGMSNRDTFKQVGLTAGLSLATIVASSTVQLIFGGCAGLVVSLSIGLVGLGFGIYGMIKDKVTKEKIDIYIIKNQRKKIIFN